MKRRAWRPLISVFLCLAVVFALTAAVSADTPTAADDTATTDEDTPVTIVVLANDNDSDNDTLSVVVATLPANGSTLVEADFSVTYTPDPDFNGSDSFTYTVDDGNAGTANATVYLTINAVNDVPVAVDDTATTDEETAVNVNVLANDSDVDGDTLSVTAVTSPANGNAAIEADSSVTYTPDLDFHGIDSFIYTIDDGYGGTANATVTVTVDNINDIPVAVDDSASTDEDTAVNINVLANDSDADGDVLSVISATAPANGGVVIEADFTITYTPVMDFNGDDSFVYTINDGNGGTANATVTVDVGSENDGPIADAGGPYEGDEGTEVVLDAAGSSDVDGDTLTYRWDFDDDGTWDTGWSDNSTAAMTWYDDWSGSARVEVSDGLLTDNTTASVTIYNIAPTPAAYPDQVVSSGDNLTLGLPFTDPGTLDTHTAVINWGEGGDETGTVSETNGSGNVTGSHQYINLGTYSVHVTVTDDDGGQATIEFTVEVREVTVTIDIKPGSDTNPINPGSNGRTPVAILTDDNFDATEADPSTIVFGPGEAAPVHFAIEDVDADGDDDMILHFMTQELGLDGFGEEEASVNMTLTGQTDAGACFEGTDTVRIVPAKDKEDKQNGKDNAPGQNREKQNNGNGKDGAPGQNKEPGSPADGKGSAPGQNKDPGSSPGKGTAPGQNKEPGTPSDGKGKGKDNAPGQNK